MARILSVAIGTKADVLTGELWPEWSRSLVANEDQSTMLVTGQEGIYRVSAGGHPKKTGVRVGYFIGNDVEVSANHARSRGGDRRWVKWNEDRGDFLLNRLRNGYWLFGNSITSPTARRYTLAVEPSSERVFSVNNLDSTYVMPWTSSSYLAQKVKQGDASGSSPRQKEVEYLQVAVPSGAVRKAFQLPPEELIIGR